MSETENIGEFLEKVSDEEAYLFAKSKLENWDFSADQSKNTYFAYVLCRWLAATFDKNSSDNWIRSSEVPGMDMPASIKALISCSYDGKTFWQNDNSLVMRPNPEGVYTPAEIPKWEQITKLKTFEQQFEAMANDPEVYENIVMPKYHIFDCMDLTYESTLDWGLDFKVYSNRIEVAAFGRRGLTWKANDYIKNYAANPKELAITASNLAVLAVSKSQRRRGNYVPVELFDNFDNWLSGEETLNSVVVPYFDKQAPPEHGIEDLLLGKLIERGLIERPNPHRQES